MDKVQDCLALLCDPDIEVRTQYHIIALSMENEGTVTLPDGRVCTKKDLLIMSIRRDKPVVYMDLAKCMQANETCVINGIVHTRLDVLVSYMEKIEIGVYLLEAGHDVLQTMEKEGREFVMMRGLHFTKKALAIDLLERRRKDYYLSEYTTMQIKLCKLMEKDEVLPFYTMNWHNKRLMSREAFASYIVNSTNKGSKIERMCQELLRSWDASSHKRINSVEGE